jgi:citrate lyase beta subunit
MPGDDWKKISKGAASGADSIIMDLEDAVALNNKPAARLTVLKALSSGEIDFGRVERLVRLNSASSGLQSDDLDAILSGKPDGFVLPKVETASELADLSRILDTKEKALGITSGSIHLVPIVETALGIVNLREIASADPRLSALIFGAEDLAGSLGAIRTLEGMEVFYARSAVVIHAAAFDLQAIDTPFVRLDDSDGLRQDAETAIRMGYAGKLVIHPNQIKPVLSAFTPSDEDIAQATRLVAAHDAHQAEGSGVFAFQGKMVDMPMIRAARRVLARAAAAGRLPNREQ